VRGRRVVWDGVGRVGEVKRNIYDENVVFEGWQKTAG
jgi:hypothetical protein